MAFSLALGVDTVRLKTQANQVEITVRDIDVQIGRLQHKLANTKYWKGTAAEFHRKDLAGKNQEIQDLLKRLHRYSADIKQMAGIYENAEGGNQGIASQLKSSVDLI